METAEIGIIGESEKVRASAWFEARAFALSPMIPISAVSIPLSTQVFARRPPSSPPEGPRN